MSVTPRPDAAAGRSTPWRFALLVFVLAAAVRLAFAGFPDAPTHERVARLPPHRVAAADRRPVPRATDHEARRRARPRPRSHRLGAYQRVHVGHRSRPVVPVARPRSPEDRGQAAPAGGG